MFLSTKYNYAIKQPGGITSHLDLITLLYLSTGIKSVR